MLGRVRTTAWPHNAVFSFTSESALADIGDLGAEASKWQAVREGRGFKRKARGPKRLHNSPLSVAPAPSECRPPEA
eukprot:8872962-Alexandrium_andersonii.AAC.1